MTTFSNKFLQALAQGYQKYLQHGAHSNEKLKPIHQCIAHYLAEELGEDYTIKSYGIGDNKEHTASGQYYLKTVDIAVIKSNKTICVISFKFVTSNYKQNNINYFEQMMGETANLRRAGCGVVQIIVLRNKTPYYDKNGSVKRIEKLTENNLSKYINLYKDKDYPHKPDLFHVVVVNINEDNSVHYCSPRELPLPKELEKILFNELSVSYFAEKIPLLCRLKA